MKELITKSKINEIISKQNIKVTSETTPKEMLEIIKTVVYHASNSINLDTTDDNTFSNIVKGMKKQGGRI